MFGELLITNKEIYRVSFGLNSLIEIEQVLNRLDEVLKHLNEPAIIKVLLYYGLNKKYDFDKIDEIANDLVLEDIAEVLKNAIYSAVGEATASSMVEIAEELYPTFVGEVGLDPTVFFDMAPNQLYLVYQGYIKRQEFAINNLLTALRLSADPEAELFSLDNELGFKLSTNTERERVLKGLNLI